MKNLSAQHCSLAASSGERPDRFVFWWMVIVHLLAIGAFFTFSWGAVGVFAGMWFISTCLGITFGYHRLLSHRSFKAPRWLERSAATCGVLALQGGPLEWVAHHRMHHSFTDTESDPHNARQGFWHSHMGWLFKVIPKFDDPAIMKRYVRDLAVDPYMLWLEKDAVQIGIQVALGLALMAVGGIGWGFWGIFFRLVLGYHFTWFVNSACHYFGYRRYDVDDLSRNNWWVSLLTWGEGWHNNHHANGSVAPSGHRWYEIDVTWYLIWSLEQLGVVWDVRRPETVGAIIREPKGREPLDRVSAFMEAATAQLAAAVPVQVKSRHG